MKIFSDVTGIPFVGMGGVFSLLFAGLAVGFLVFVIIMVIYMLIALTLLVLGIVFAVLGSKEKKRQRAMGILPVKSKKSTAGIVFLCIGIPLFSMPIIWFLTGVLQDFI